MAREATGRTSSLSKAYIRDFSQEDAFVSVLALCVSTCGRSGSDEKLDVLLGDQLPSA